jgi:hypothetical protein
MKITALSLLFLAAFFAFVGIKVLPENARQNFGVWVGGLFPAVLLLYMAIRAWNDKPEG